MRVHEVLKDEKLGTYYMACELLKGGDLSKRIKKLNGLPEDKVAYIIKQVL